MEEACSWPCRGISAPRSDESCWSTVVPKLERDDELRIEPWRLPDLRPPLHYLHDRDGESCAACVGPLPLLPPPAPAPH